MSDRVRIDVWLWSVRVYKTRSQATAACRAGHVQLEGDRVKAAALVGPGSRIHVRKDGRDLDYEVTRVIRKRVGAEVAASCLIDHSPPAPVRPLNLGLPQRDRGAGRPTKRERRELDRLRGRG